MFSKIRSTKTAASFLVFVTVVFSLWLSATAKAQVAGATRSGTVTDQSGGVIPQASISAKNVAIGITRASTARSAGFYSASNLLPGIYDVTVTAQGFSTDIRTGIELTVGEQRALDFTLHVGKTSQKVV
jgi:Carboxypeptidase regulatory-like domain